jgi:hypothetical protein
MDPGKARSRVPELPLAIELFEESPIGGGAMIQAWWRHGR